MEHEPEDNRCANWNHVWMHGCQTCVENRARQQALSDAVAAVEALDDGKTAPPNDGYAEAVAAITALGGER